MTARKRKVHPKPDAAHWPDPEKEPRAQPYANEEALAEAVNDWIRDVWRGTVLNVHGNGRQTSGQPDTFACVRHRMVTIELKQPGKVPTPLQFKRLREWEGAGALVGWATTVAEVHELLLHVDDLEWVNPQMDPALAGSTVI